MYPGGLNWLLKFSKLLEKLYSYLIVLIHQFFPQWQTSAIPSNNITFLFLSLITHCGVEWHSGGTDPPCNALPDLRGWHRGKPRAQVLSSLTSQVVLSAFPFACTRRYRVGFRTWHGEEISLSWPFQISHSCCSGLEQFLPDVYHQPCGSGRGGTHNL